MGDSWSFLLFIIIIGYIELKVRSQLYAQYTLISS